MNEFLRKENLTYNSSTDFTELNHWRRKKILYEKEKRDRVHGW